MTAFSTEPGPSPYYTAEHEAFRDTSLYDSLDRLDDAKVGILDNNEVVQVTKIHRIYDMDVLGNFTGGIKVNDTSVTITHTVNSTNEITTIDHTNPAGAAAVVNEPFTSSLNNFWTAHEGTWSISSNTVNVDTLVSNHAVLLADPDFGISNYAVDVKFPSFAPAKRAGRRCSWI